MSLDGIPMRASGFCNVNQLFEANTEQAGTVEVIRGPGSILYGANALHGAINIISAPISDSASRDFSYEIGPHKYNRIRGTVSDSIGAHGYRISFNGNLGDFGLARDAQEIVHYLTDLDVPVYINTNGSNHNGAWWAQLVHPRVCITFDLDGLEDTHHLYRLQTDWQRVVRNARAFIAAGGRAVWQMIPFDHNRHQIDACREMSTNMGFEKFVLCDQGRNQGPVYDRQGNFTHWLGTATTPPPPLKDMLESHITWYRADQVRAMGSSNIQCYAQRSREIYIAADGTVYPCCYLGFYPDTMQHAGNEQVKQIAQGNNAL
jgi:outer membrane receptor protein involved in Fe transport